MMSPCFFELFILLVKVNIYLCARGRTCWDLGSPWEKGGAKEVLMTILLLWFPSRAAVGCHDVAVPLE